MVVDKKGSEKYYLLMSLILGLIILGISLWFIFYEYFSEEDINWETCRTSIYLRSGNLAHGAKYVQENFPFKCQTEVLEIDYVDEERALKEIADSLASCYYLFGEGRLSLFGPGWFSSKKICFVCSRIHFSEDVKSKYANLDVGDYIIKTPFNEKGTYFDYIYWDKPERPKNLKRDDLEKRVRDLSVFDASNGDILVANNYLVGSLGGAAITSPFTGTFDVPYGMIIEFYQPSVRPELLEGCDEIETIPA
jgi:hypothetical protein